MRIFIAGTGFCGSAAAARLRREGHEVLGLSRRPRTGEGGLVGDVLEPGGLHALASVPPVDLLLIALAPGGERDPARVRALYVEGPARVADALSWRARRRVWFLGSTGVYGNADGRWVDEDTPPQPTHFAGEVQLQAESALRAVADETCVLRLSGLYGPGRTRLLRQALRRRPFFKPDLWSNQIHRDDVAGVVAFLASRAEAPPPLLLVSDDRPALRREIFEWVRRETGKPEGVYDEDHPASAVERGNKRVSNRRLRALGAPLLFPDYLSGLAPLFPQLPSLHD